MAELSALHRSTRVQQGGALLMSETAALYLRQQPASPSSSSLPPPAAPRGGRGVRAVCVNRGNCAGRGVWRRGGVCVKEETLTLEVERLGLGAWQGAAGVSLALACLCTAVRAGERLGVRAGRDWRGGEWWELCFCCGFLWPEAGFLPLWMSVVVGVTPGCLSVYTVYFIKELEQSRQDFSSCLSSQWSH